MWGMSSSVPGFSGAAGVWVSGVAQGFDGGAFVSWC